MKSTLLARTILMALTLFLAACTNDVALSNSTSSEDSTQSGDNSNESGTENDDSNSAGQEEELTPAQLEALEAEAAAALVIRKSFDKLVFACGLERDLGQCVELREVLDSEAEEELIERCDIQDKVACDALSHTIIADLQVGCIYEDDAEACDVLELSWNLDDSSNYGLQNSMSEVLLESIEADCLLGGVLECAELEHRKAS